MRRRRRQPHETLLTIASPTPAGDRPWELNVYLVRAGCNCDWEDIHHEFVGGIEHVLVVHEPHCRLLRRRRKSRARTIRRSP